MEYKLIESVQMFPCLFEKSRKDYKNKLTKEKSWASVAAAVGVTVGQCQSRWRSLRDRYVREVSTKPKSGAGAEEKCKWRYMDSMSFLQKHVAPRRTFSNMEWTSPETEILDEMHAMDFVIMEDESSLNMSSAASTSAYFPDEDSAAAEKSKPKRPKKQEEAHQKFDLLCGAVGDLIAAKKENSDKSRNADFLKVLDSYLLKHSEEDQDKLKMQILNLVYNGT